MEYHAFAAVRGQLLDPLHRAAAAGAPGGGQGRRLRRRRVLVAVAGRRCPPTPTSTPSSPPSPTPGAARRAELLRRRHAGRRPRPGLLAGPLRRVPGQHRRRGRHRRAAGRRASTRSTATGSTTRPRQQDELAAENLALAARRPRRIGGTVLLEPVSGPAATRCSPPTTSLGVIDRVRATGAENIGSSATSYHLASTATTSTRPSTSHADRIGHVQIADAPGRGEPGTGELPLDRDSERLAGQRVRRLGRPGVQAQRHHRRRASPGCPRAAPRHPAHDRDPRKETSHDDAPSHSSASGIMGCPWPPTSSRPATTSSATTAARTRSRSSVDAGGQGAEPSPRPSRAPTSSSRWCRTRPTSRPSARARTASSRTPSPGAL